MDSKELYIVEKRSGYVCRPCVISIDGVIFEAHPRDGQNDVHINEVARRFVAEYNK